MAATGIGFAGIDGPWWLPACEPFVLPQSAADQLHQIATAVFTFLDVVGDLYGAADGRPLTDLLRHKLPAHIPQLVSQQRVLSLRPDFQLVQTAAGLQLVATELEICPSAQGFAHAMQVGYGLETDLADAFARSLNGRPLFILGSQQWSEFLIEQLAFCRALAERGATAWVLYDRPLSSIAAEIATGRRWQPPMFGISRKPPGWNPDLLGRLRDNDLLRYWWPNDEQWPERLGNSAVFRFGYFNCFTAGRLAQFGRWEAAGATFLNPTTFYLESKLVLAALQLPVVRERLTAATLATLDACLPPTLPLTADTLPQLLANKDEWVIKFAGYDDGGNDWGGRSLQVGRAQTAAEWETTLHHALALPWPVVAQPYLPSQRIDITYEDSNGRIQTMLNANTRLRSFFLRAGQCITPCGTHLTASHNPLSVSEATDTIQAPVVYSGQ
jgi:hypothetical protein